MHSTTNHAEVMLLSEQYSFGIFFIRALAGSGRSLREGALESPSVIDLLKESYVSCWALVIDLEVH